MGIGRLALPREVEWAFWRAVGRGSSTVQASAEVGVSQPLGSRWVRQRGGVNPSPREPSGRFLSFAEREEIACLNERGLGVRAIARELDREPSTISRELVRARPRRGPYRARYAQSVADGRPRYRPPAKLATNVRLRGEVQARLMRNNSPEQIAARLRVDFPEEPEMWVSHETIYQSLYVQGRGGLRRELTKNLRTGRAVRKPRRVEGQRAPKIAGMVLISERPPEIEDRSVPGHWEGDLIIGARNASAIGTLVERATGFVMLLHLGGKYTAESVQHAMVETMSSLPATLRRTVTWDQGREMANHLKIAAATDLDIYFCDPHSPWQRGSNENTNGLLRQYFPKGTDLNFWGPGFLQHVADELNDRPRKRLGWATPTEALAKLLSEQQPPGVASSG
jgi:IS30 family transposase